MDVDRSGIAVGADGWARKTVVAATPYVLLAVFSMLAYGASLRMWFGSDDPVISFTVARDGPLGMWWTGGNFVRPVFSVVWWLNWKMFGLNPGPYHAINIALFIGAAFLLWHIARRLLRWTGLEPGRWSGWLVPALFVVWPHHTEPVVWLAARTDLIAVALAASAVLVFVMALDSGRNRTYLASMLLFASALLAKESVVALPLFFLALAVVSLWLGVRQRNDGVLVWGLGSFLVSALYLVLRVYKVGNLVGGYGKLHTNFSGEAFARGALSHLYACFVPFRLPNGPLDGALLPLVVSGLAVMALVVLASKRNSAMLKLAGVLLIGIVASLLPVANLNSWLNGEQERWAYLASLWSIALMGIAFEVAAGTRRAVLLALFLAIVGLPRVRATLEPWQRVSDEMRREYDLLSAVVRPGPVIIVCADNIVDGAIKWTNGLAEALELGSVTRSDQVHVLSHLANPMPGDVLTATRVGPKEVKLSLKYDPTIRRNFPPLILEDQRVSAMVTLLVPSSPERPGESEVTILFNDEPQGQLLFVHRGEVRSLD